MIAKFRFESNDQFKDGAHAKTLFGLQYMTLLGLLYLPVLEWHGNEQFLCGREEHFACSTILWAGGEPFAGFCTGATARLETGGLWCQGCLAFTRHSMEAARAILSYLKALALFLNMFRGSCPA